MADLPCQGCRDRDARIVELQARVADLKRFQRERAGHLPAGRPAAPEVEAFDEAPVAQTQLVDGQVGVLAFGSGCVLGGIASRPPFVNDALMTALLSSLPCLPRSKSRRLPRSSQSVTTPCPD